VAEQQRQRAEQVAQTQETAVHLQAQAQQRRQRIVEQAVAVAQMVATVAQVHRE